MRAAGPAPAVSWRKRSRKRPRCPFVSYKQPAALPSEGTRRGRAARPKEAAEEGPPAAPGSSRHSGPLGPHACPPALPEPQVRGRRGARLRGWAGGARGPCASSVGRRAGGGLQAGSSFKGPPGSRPAPGREPDGVRVWAKSGVWVLVGRPWSGSGSGSWSQSALGLGCSPGAGFNPALGASRSP
jgi:hypothetical protein